MIPEVEDGVSIQGLSMDGEERGRGGSWSAIGKERRGFSEEEGKEERAAIWTREDSMDVQVLLMSSL